MAHNLRKHPRVFNLRRVCAVSSKWLGDDTAKVPRLEQGLAGNEFARFALRCRCSLTDLPCSSRIVIILEVTDSAAPRALLSSSTSQTVQCLVTALLTFPRSFCFPAGSPEIRGLNPSCFSLFLSAPSPYSAAPLRSPFFFCTPRHDGHDASRGAQQRHPARQGFQRPGVEASASVSARPRSPQHQHQRRYDRGHRVRQRASAPRRLSSPRPLPETSWEYRRRRRRRWFEGGVLSGI